MTLEKLKITFLSDWHIGSGSGRSGSIDRLVKRDRQGLPFVPAKTLTGILRDACELLAHSFDAESDSQFWEQWVLYLFGDQPALERTAKEQAPQPAAFSLRSAHFPESFCAAMGDKLLLKEALTFVKPGVSIELSSGTAKPDFLRFEEMARVGAVLEASCELAAIADPEQQATAEAILIAGAQLVERLGAKRRRGAGRCRLEFENADLQTAIAQLEKAHPPAPPKRERELITIAQSSASSAGWYVLDILLTTKSPLTIHKRTVGNVIETLDYIPGACLLPIVSQKLRSSGFNLGSAIANGHLIVTHATPEVAGNVGLPIPFTFAKDKMGETYYNKLRSSVESARQVKGLRAGYIAQSESKIHYLEVSTQVETHNTVQDDLQRPHEEVGGVYSYEAMPPDQTFRAQLRLRHHLFHQDYATLPDALRSLTGKVESVQIGRTKKDDYGWADLKFIEVPESVPHIVSNELSVLLLSDVLLRDRRLRPTTRIEDFTDALGQELNQTLELVGHFARHRRTDSWQTRWGLPRPSLIGLSAGTCLRFKSASPIDAVALKELETKGIGERTAEGYGQLCFNPAFLEDEHLHIHKLEANSSQQSSLQTALLSDEDSYAQIIEQAAWREAMRRAAIAIAASPERRKEILGFDVTQQKPTMSQLGTLRSRLQSLTESETKSFQQWLIKLRENRSDRWTKESLNELDRLVQPGDYVWQHYTRTWQEQLAMNDAIAQITLTQSGEARLKDILRIEAIQLLVDACIRSHKRDCESTPKTSIQ